MGQATATAPAPGQPYAKGAPAPPPPQPGRSLGSAPPGSPAESKGAPPGQPPQQKGAPQPGQPPQFNKGAPPPGAPQVGAGAPMAPAGPTTAGSTQQAVGGDRPGPRDRMLPQQGVEEGQLAGRPRAAYARANAIDPNAPPGTAQQGSGYGQPGRGFNSATATPAQIRQQIAADAAAGRPNEIFRDPAMQQRFPDWQARFFGGAGSQPTGSRFTTGPRQVNETGDGTLRLNRPAQWERDVSRGGSLNYNPNVTAPDDPWYSRTRPAQEDRERQRLQAQELRDRRAARQARQARAAAAAAAARAGVRPPRDDDSNQGDGGDDGGDGGGDGGDGGDGDGE